MLPSQLQYKDVITRILPGFLICIVVTFIGLFFFPPTVNEIVSWFSIDIKEFLLLFVPITLAVSYAIGSALGTIHFMLIQIAYGYGPEKKFDGGRLIYFPTRWLFKRFFFIAKHPTNKDPRFEPLLSDDMDYYIELRKRISKTFGIKIEKVAEQFDQKSNRRALNLIYEAVMNYNRTVSVSPAVLEIQRYSIIMEFNAQLAIIFCLSFFASFVAFINCFVGFCQLTWFERPFYFWLLLSVCFFYFTRKCANKSIRDWREKCGLIYSAFFHLSILKDKDKAKSEESGL
jgi:hypothetical protein